MSLKLRSYRTKGRAEAYAAILRRRFPKAAFEVRTSPFATYGFKFLIICTRGADGCVGGAWVSK